MARPLETYRGQGYTRQQGCVLPAHYREVQAICDALGYAAQQEMAESIERGDALGRERAYGKWLGVRGLLRAIEARLDEWSPREYEMLQLIDWSKEQFQFPGKSTFDVPLSEPGAGEEAW